MNLHTIYEEDGEDGHQGHVEKIHVREREGRPSISYLLKESCRIEDAPTSLVNKRMRVYGMIVQKCYQRSIRKRYKRLTFTDTYMYVSSMTSTKVIAINEVRCAKTRGRRLILETERQGLVVFRMPTVSDALAFRNILR